MTQLLRVKQNFSDLVNEILDKIPQDKLIYGKVLDPEMGGGQIMVEVERRKRAAGLTEKEITNSCYGFVEKQSRVYYVYNKYKLVGNYIKWDALEGNIDMKFDVIVGNPPYQNKREDKKGIGGDNALYIKFIETAVDLCEDSGIVAMVTPPAAFTKTTIRNTPSETLGKIIKSGNLVSLDLDAKKHFSVGVSICWWLFKKGEKQGSIEFKKDYQTKMMPLSSIYFIPPKFNQLELDLFNKIMNNKEGEEIVVTRGPEKPNREYTMNRLGYPKIQKGGDGALGFESKFADFMLSKLGLWLLDYIRRHDSFIYHNILTGIRLPDDGFLLNKEETDFINNGDWRNFGVKEHNEHQA